MAGRQFDSWRFSDCVLNGPIPVVTERIRLSAERLYDPALWRAVGRLFRLSPRQTEVLSLICRGVPSARIAEGLGVTGGTLKIHRRAVYQKLGVCCIEQAMAKAILASGVLIHHGDTDT